MYFYLKINTPLFISLLLSPKFIRTLISSIHRQHTIFLDRSVRFLFRYRRLTMESSSSVITPEDVMGTLMNDGTIDSMRLKIITQLKANEELKNTTIKMVEQSRVLNTPGAEKQTKRELFDALRQELETSVLEKASKSVWELILDNKGIGKEISETVEQVFCRLSGREAPLFVSDFGPQPEKGKEKKSGQKEENSETGKDNSESAVKKRKMNTEEEFDEAVCKSSDKSPSSDDSSKMPPPSVRSQSTS